MRNTKNCVISAVGRESLHRKWLEGEPDFDLHLIVYDDSLERFRGDAEHVCHIKGYKLKSVYRYLAARPELLGRYEYFFIPDDDILMDAVTINALFAAMRHYRLKIAQPALCRSYYTWGHTLRDRYCRLRYTDFVEMMVPCFSREALEKVLFTFNENETGWGTETHWPLLVDAGPRDMAIIDEVGVVHTRPIQSGQPLHRQELAAYLRKYNLTTKVHMYDTVSGEGRFCCDRDTFRRHCTVLRHWTASELASEREVSDNDWAGYVHVLFLLAGITEDRRYLDAALGQSGGGAVPAYVLPHPSDGRSTPLERVYGHFRSYRQTHEAYDLACVREGLKNLPPRLMALEDAVMLAEMLSYQVKKKEEK